MFLAAKQLHYFTKKRRKKVSIAQLTVCDNMQGGYFFLLNQSSCVTQKILRNGFSVMCFSLWETPCAVVWTHQSAMRTYRVTRGAHSFSHTQAQTCAHANIHTHTQNPAKKNKKTLELHANPPNKGKALYKWL